MVVNGKRYSHMTDFCREYNISITKFRGLIGRGFSPAEALNCIKLQELGKIKKSKHLPIEKSHLGMRLTENLTIPLMKLQKITVFLLLLVHTD